MYEKILNKIWENATKKTYDIEKVVQYFDNIVKDKIETLEEFGYGAYNFKSESKEFRQNMYNSATELERRFKNAVLNS